MSDGGFTNKGKIPKDMNIVLFHLFIKRIPSVCWQLKFVTVNKIKPYIWLDK